MRMKYEVTFNRKDITHVNIVIADDQASISAWYKKRKPDAEILDIRPATAESEKPGIPFIEVSADFLQYK